MLNSRIAKGKALKKAEKEAAKAVSAGSDGSVRQRRH